MTFYLSITAAVLLAFFGFCVYRYVKAFLLIRRLTLLIAEAERGQTLLLTGKSEEEVREILFGQKK